MPQNLTPAKRGRFQTRLSRLVDITSSKIIQEPVPGQPGKTVARTIWLGTLYASNGKTPEGNHEWETDGSFRNQKGVATPNDLAIYVGKYPGQEDDPAPELTQRIQEQGQEISDAHLNAALAPEPVAAPPVPAQVDDRLTLLIGGFVVDLYEELIAIASAAGLDVTGRPALIRGPWIEAVNQTLVAIMDTPATTNAALKHEELKEEPNTPAPIVAGDGIAHDPSAAA